MRIAVGRIAEGRHYVGVVPRIQYCRSHYQANKYQNGTDHGTNTPQDSPCEATSVYQSCFSGIRTIRPSISAVTGSWQPRRDVSFGS